MDAIEDVQEWINSVWRGFLGYGAAICSLVMLIFCMAWCFRRTARNQAPPPAERVQVIFHDQQEDRDPQVELPRAVATATPPPCVTAPPAKGLQPKANATPMEADTIAQILAKNAI